MLGKIPNSVCGHREGNPGCFLGQYEAILPSLLPAQESLCSSGAPIRVFFCCCCCCCYPAMSTLTGMPLSYVHTDIQEGAANNIPLCCLHAK